MLIKHMREGLSFESFAGVIETSRSVLYDWCKVYPEFLDAKKAGMELCLLYWEQAGRNALFEEKFRDSLWIFNMKARFQWADRVVVKDEEREKERKSLEEKFGNKSLEELKAIIKHLESEME